MENDLPEFVVVEWYHGTLHYELTIISNGKRFHIYFTPESIRGPEGDETLVNIFREFEEVMDDDEDASEAFEDWMIQPCASYVKQLAPPTPNRKIPTLAEYLNPETFVLRLENVGGHFEASICPKPAGGSSMKFGISWGTLMSDPSVAKAISRGVPWIPASQLALGLSPAALGMDYSLMPRAVQSLGKESQYYFKCASERSSFAREVTALLDIKEKFPHDNLRVSKLAGLAACDDGLSIAGLLMEYLHESKTLAHYVSRQEASNIMRVKWAKQVRETVKRLHDADIIWGDVQPNNVLIDPNGDAWVIDFGGGYVLGWVDGDIAGTKEGDLQGLSKLDKYLEIEDAGHEVTGRGSPVDSCVDLKLGATKEDTLAQPAMKGPNEADGSTPVDSCIGLKSDAMKQDLRPQRPLTERLNINGTQDTGQKTEDGGSPVDSCVDLTLEAVKDNDIQPSPSTNGHVGINPASEV
jgi:hypothetical protein